MSQIADVMFPRFSHNEYIRRTAAIHEAMDKDGLEAILISGARGSSDVQYLSELPRTVALLAPIPTTGRADGFRPFL